MKNKKTKTLSQLKTKADQVFSKKIRSRDKHRCFTCGKQMEENESQNGHYKSRVHLSTRYSEKNCHCQCVSCNIFKGGNLTVYAIRLEAKYGGGILQELEAEARKTVKNARALYESIINK